MKLLGASLSLALATGAHLALWAAMPGADGNQGGGSTGADTVTLSALVGDYSAVLQAWDTPPKAQIEAPKTPEPMRQTPALNLPKLRDHTPRPTPAALILPPTDDPAPARPEAPNPNPDSANLPEFSAASADVAAAIPLPAPRPNRAARPAALAPPSPELAPPSASPDTQPKQNTTLRPVPRPQTKQATRPTPQPKKPAPPPRAASVAKGSKSAATSGKSGNNGASKLNKSHERKLQAAWSAKIYGKVQRSLRWPTDSKAGKVSVQIFITQSGKLLDARVVKSSGNATLDKAALRAIKRIGRYPKAPKGYPNYPRSKFSLQLTNPG